MNTTPTSISPTSHSNSSLGLLGWLGVIILLGLLVFKWIPEWTWQPKAPEITVNEFIFETNPVWSGDEATIGGIYPPSIYIRIRPDEAADKRANLNVLVNNKTVTDNCSYNAKYFCYKIESNTVKDGNKYEVVARNDAGEKRIILNIKLNTTPETKPSEPESKTPDIEDPKSQDTTSTEQQSESTSTSPVPYVKSSSCLHYEAGRCWDEYENEMYSSGLYDHNYGYYGGSFMPPDDCDQTCQDILEDAYEEGYYDF